MMKFFEKLMHDNNAKYIISILIGFLISPGNIVLIIGTKISNEKPLITSDIAVRSKALTNIFSTVICRESFNILLKIKYLNII